MNNRYASETQVSCESSRNQIERTLAKYGASEFVYAARADRAIVAFKMHNRMVRFELPLPDKSQFETRIVRGRAKSMSQDQSLKMWEKACRQRWRALNLVILAKLEAVGCAISLFEEEFLAQIVLPDGSTVGQNVIPLVNNAYITKEMPRLLPYLAEDK